MTDDFTSADEDFTREEALLRAALDRHADDVDEPVAFEHPRRSVDARRWLAAVAAVAVLGGTGGYWWAHRPVQEAPGPSAVTATPTTTPSMVRTPTASVTPTVTPTSPTPAPSSASARPSATVTPSASSPASSSTPSVSTSATRTPTPSGQPTGPRTSSSPSAGSSELGDRNPTDPTPAPADQLSVDTPVTPTGWGAYQLGMTAKQLQAKGLVVASTAACEGSMEPITASKVVGLRAIGLATTAPLYQLEITNPAVRTDKGAHVGMTMAQVRAVYGSSFAFETKSSESSGTTLVMARVRQGTHEILFVTAKGGADKPATPTSVVTSIIVRDYSLSVPYPDAC